MYKVLIRSISPTNNPQPRGWIRNTLDAPFARRANVDALWCLTTMPLSVSISAIVLGLIVRLFRAS
jgi:hypothetical protein